MSKYGRDRDFTDRVHKVAIERIYKLLNWQEESIDRADITGWIDLNVAFDYVFKDKFDNKIFVQERFRDKKYSEYTDFTLRYKRNQSPYKERRLSEFFKIRADYLVYGVVDRSKEEVIKGSNFSFNKYVVVNLRLLFCLIELGYIMVAERFNKSKYDDKILYCPVKNNADNSSSFVVFDVIKLHELVKNL